MAERYGCAEEFLAHYACQRAAEPIDIDGDLDKPVWRNARRSVSFVDLVTGGPAPLETRIAALWDERCLYVGYWIEEPQVRASLTERDSFIWHDNDVELFIAGDDCYYELEINAYGTVYEAFFIWQDALTPGSRFDVPGLDLRTRNVDLLGGFQDGSRWGKHPRGRRWAFLDWDLVGLQTAVRVEGVINDPRVRDRGWTVEMALPWAGLRSVFAERPWPPCAGDTPRIDFSRFEVMDYGGRQGLPSAGWALNPHGVYDSHIPECFSFVHLEAASAS
jgi:hypothetical protein